MEDYTPRVIYNLNPIALKAVEDAAFQIIENWEAKHPGKEFNIENLSQDINELSDGLIRFFHTLSLRRTPDKPIATTSRITGKSPRTIDRRVNL